MILRRALIVIAASSFAFSSSAKVLRTATIDELLKGVVIEEELRFRITDVRAGETSVLTLFAPIAWRSPSVREFVVATRDRCGGEPSVFGVGAV